MSVLRLLWAVVQVALFFVMMLCVVMQLSREECAYQMISLGNANHSVDVRSDGGWVVFGSGAAGCMEVRGEEGGRLAGRLAGTRDPPPGGQKVTKIHKFAHFR